MKKIYVCHSNGFDFKTDFYVPLKKTNLFKNSLVVLPHDSNKHINSKKIIQSSDFVLAEISYPSIGLGIELGWADVYKIPIICIYKKGCKISRSVHFLTKKVFQYENIPEIDFLLKSVI